MSPGRVVVVRETWSSGKVSELSRRYSKSFLTGMALVEAQYIGSFCSVEALGSFPFLVPAPNIFVALSVFILIFFILFHQVQSRKLQLAVQATSLLKLT